MIKDLYTVASSMLPKLTYQQIVANNLANINTPGFKRDGLFLETLIQVGIPPQGQQIGTIYTDFSPGPLLKTERKLDLAIDGNGFFTIFGPEGEKYTRNGSFYRRPDGVLATVGGNPVLGENGIIVLPEGDPVVNKGGQIYVRGEYIDKLLITDFPQPYHLVKSGSGLFVPQNRSNGGYPAQNATVRQGFLEGSNVKPVEEMVNMLISYRQYQAAQRVIQTQDDALRKSVNEIGTVR